MPLPINKRLVEKAVKDLILSIKSAGARRAVVSVYDDAQGGADVPEGSTEEEDQWIQHGYALESVSVYLIDHKLVPPVFEDLTDDELRLVLDETISIIH